MNASEALLQFSADRDATDQELIFDHADLSPTGMQALVDAGKLPQGETPGSVDLSGRPMQGASFRSADLSEANLSDADLSDISAGGCVLRGARLEGANLHNADLVGANLSAAHAGEANFSGALLEDARMNGAQLRFADFSDATLDGAEMSDADLWGAKFRSAAADRVQFRSARLDESSLTEADFSGADFFQATLRRADLSMARLQNANFREATLDGANLAGANLKGALLPNLSLTSCDLTRVSFAGAWLERTRMRAHQLGGQVGEEAAGDLQGAVDSYIVLERNFLSLGNSEDASWAYLRRRQVGRRLHGRDAQKQLKAKNWSSGARSAALWISDVAAEWLCNYGESLYRVARAFVTILLVFAVVYWLTGSLRLREGFSGAPRWDPINYLLFSLDSMTTVGTSEVALRPKGELGILLSSLQTVLGTVLLGLFGFVLGARIRS